MNRKAADSPDDGAPPFVSESESPACEAHAFVLAGGRSSRMGQDKAMVLYHGRPLIEHALTNLRSLRLTPAIAGNRADLAGYAVYRSDGASAVVRLTPSDKPVDTPAFHDATAQAGHTYGYSVTAIDRDGNESPRSTEVKESLPAKP